MASPVAAVSVDTPLDAAYEVMVERGVSALPVVDKNGRAAGVISRTDLLRVGRLEPASLAGVRPLELPSDAVSIHMHAGVVVLPKEATMREAATLMVDHKIHRVYIEEAGKLAGVVSTEEVLLALRTLRILTPLREVMSSPVLTIADTATLADATARLDHAHVTGLAVVDSEGYPVGMFGQMEALLARDLPATTKVDEVMSYAMLRERPDARAYRAAAHAYETRARRVLVMDDRALLGVVTGLDFARVLATA